MGDAHFSRGGTKRVLLMFLWMLGSISLSYAARPSVSRQKLQVQKHLNRLNKPGVKTIQVNKFFFLFAIFVCLVENLC